MQSGNIWCGGYAEDEAVVLVKADWYRFSREEFLALVDLLEIPSITFSNRLRPSPELALAITLHRLTWPNRWYTGCDYFGRSTGYLSTVFTEVILHLDATFGRLLEWHPRLDDRRRLERFGEAVAGVDGPREIWGFIDGTFKAFRRPEVDQEGYYSGHYKGHGAKFQGVVTPDGIISSLCGPFSGKDNDVSMYRRSIVIEKMRAFNIGRVGEADRIFLYGDAAYDQMEGVLAPVIKPKRQKLNRRAKRYNKALARVRISVEHGFGDVQNLWTYQAFSKGISVGQQPVGPFYRAAVLLTNIFTCFRGSNRTSARFAMSPPLVHEYLEVRE